MSSSSSALRLRERYNETEWADPHLLQGESQYVLSGSGNELDAIINAYPGVCERLDEKLLLLNFGNAVGFFTFPGLGRVEVRSGKWSEKHFHKMLSDLTVVAAGLPFTATIAAALPYERSSAVSESVLYHAFVYVRHILSESAPAAEQILPAVDVVIRDPHRRFVHVRRRVPIEEVRRVDPKTLIGMVTGRQQLIRASSALGSIAPLLRGHVPERVDEGQVDITHDTPENRFVKAFLGTLARIVEDMRVVMAAKGASDRFARRIVGDCDDLERKLRPVLQASLWKDVGPMVHLPIASPVLQQRRGYRETLRHFVRLRLATRVPFGKELIHDLLEGKDIAELYELWCYFTLVRVLETILGQPRRADRPETGKTAITVPWDFEVAWASGTRVLYNPRFSRSRTASRKSYSVPLRPDIGLDIAEGLNQGLHLLDAKFKLDKIDSLLPKTEEDEPEAEIAAERKGTFKRGDLYKMHTYRDAIPAARSVWIIYPGTEARFFGTGRERVLSPSDDFPEILTGVGAIPLVPGDEMHPHLQAVLKQLI